MLAKRFRKTLSESLAFLRTPRLRFRGRKRKSMCGIAGQLVLDADGTIDEDKIIPCLGPAASRPGRVGLLRRRPAAGDPRRRGCRSSTWSPGGSRWPTDRTIWVACNGEIYEFEQLAAELAARGTVSAPQRQRSDRPPLRGVRRGLRRAPPRRVRLRPLRPAATAAPVRGATVLGSSPFTTRWPAARCCSRPK